MDPKLLFSPQLAGIKMSKPRTPMGALFSVGPGTPSSASKGHLPGQTPIRDNLIKVTFQAVHDNSPPGSTMYVTGSLPSLGCWDAKRARKMIKSDEKTWQLAVYIPERAEFLYQYLLLNESSDTSKDPEVLWEGGLERKCKLDAAGATPNKQHFLSDDTRNEVSSPVAVTRVKSGIASIATGGMSNQEKAEMQEEIDELTQERSRCQNELTKLKDLITSAFNVPETSDYKKRESYIPDSGALYDTIRQIQSLIRPRVKKARMDLSSAASDDSAGPAAAAAAAAEDTPPSDQAEALRKQIEEHVRSRREVEERYAAELAAAAARCEALEADLAAARGQAEAQAANQGQALARMAEREARASRAAEALAGFCGGARDEAAGMAAEVAEALAGVEPLIAEHVESATGVMREEVARVGGKLRREVAERRRLHNLVQELRGNIRVFCRVRPQSAKDNAAGSRAAITFPTEGEALVDVGGGKAQSFAYDAVFGPASSQEEVFEETQPLVVSVLDGFNVCIFAYGQTGSGKTHTMQGSAERRGVNMRALEELFRMAEERKELGFTYEIQVSVLEIYNETIRDLVEPKDEGGVEDKKLDVKLSPDGNGTCVPGLASVSVSSMAEVESVLKAGERNRSVGKTNMNEHSSRSHMILSVVTRSFNEATGARAFGKMHLVDLAGSERVGRSGAEGDRLKEAQNINKSLSALGDCVQSLVAKAKHIPFRNSKLTFLLQDSLGGDSKALMFVCVSPSDVDVNESLCSLNFASRVRNVELGPAKRKTDAAPGGAGGGKATEAARKAQEEAERRVRQLEVELQQQITAAATVKTEMERKLAAALGRHELPGSRTERIRREASDLQTPTKKAATGATPSKALATSSGAAAPRGINTPVAASEFSKENTSPVTPAVAGQWGAAEEDSFMAAEGGEQAESSVVRISPSKRRESSALQPRADGNETPSSATKKPRPATARPEGSCGQLQAPSLASRIPRPALSASASRLTRAATGVSSPAATTTASKRQSLGGWR